MYNILLILVVAFTSILIDTRSALAVLLVFLLGKSLLYITNCKNDNYSYKVYDILYICGSTYFIICYIYMRANGFEWLFAFDTYNFYLPSIEKFISDSNYNYSQTLSEIFSKEFTLLSYDKHLYFIYSCLWAICGYATNIDQYFIIQLSVLFLFPLIGVIIYKLLLLNNFDKKKSAKFAIIICVCSTIFYYSSQILRDLHILFFSLLAIYYTFKPTFSIINIFKILLCIICISSLRIESGLFMIILIPTYIYTHQKKQRNVGYTSLVTIIITILAVIILSKYIGDASEIYEANNEHFSENISEGGGVIGTLQKIPVVGDILSVIYNALQPLPFWSRLAPTSADKYGYEAYNIMGFVRIIASFFNLMTIIYIFVWLFTKSIRKNISKHISTPLKYQLWIGFIFLYIQSAVISQRRLLPYYCIFYILFIIIYSNISRETKKELNNIAIITFIFIQIASALIL